MASDDSEKMVRAVYSMTPTMKGRIKEYYFEHRLESEAEALRQLVEIGFKHAPKPKAKR